MDDRDYIDEDVKYVIGDGIITYYRNGIYVNYKIIESNELKRKTEYDTE
jgi:hypothetical protein|tara:strand:+ start:1458 stop:1604 length:147 start_codon:yes stop_codon:yes gene_type:complete